MNRDWSEWSQRWESERTLQTMDCRTPTEQLFTSYSAIYLTLRTQWVSERLIHWLCELCSTPKTTTEMSKLIIQLPFDSHKHSNRLWEPTLEALPFLSFAILWAKCWTIGSPDHWSSPPRRPPEDDYQICWGQLNHLESASILIAIEWFGLLSEVPILHWYVFHVDNGHTINILGDSWGVRRGMRCIWCLHTSSRGIVISFLCLGEI